MTSRCLLLVVSSLVAACAGDTPSLTAEADPPTATALDVAPGSGLKLGLVTGNVYDDLVANRGARMRDLQELGVKLLRVEIVGGDFTKYRLIVDAARRYGIEVLALVQSNAVGFRPGYDIDSYINAYIAVVDRLLAEVPNLRYIEVENEPDGYDFTPLTGDNAIRFASLVTRVFEHYASSRQDGRPQIVAFDFARQDQPAFDEVYNSQPITNHRLYFRAQHGLPDGLPADIVSIHGYGDFSRLPDEPGYGYNGMTMDQQVQYFLGRQFANAVQGNTSIINASPVWYTEVGFGSNLIGGEDRQATAIHQAMQILRRYGQITGAFYYDYRDDEAGGGEYAGLRGNSGTSYGTPCGIVDQDHPGTLPFAPKLAYSAFQQEAGGGGRTTFSDVPACFWSHDAVEALYARGITRGCNGGTYADGTLAFCEGANVTVDEIRVFIGRAAGQNPDGPYVSPPATRREMARQLAQAIGAYGDYDGHFADIGPNDPDVHAIYGLWQRRTGNPSYPDQRVATGSQIGDAFYFSPGDPLTRSQMAVFLGRAYNLH